MTAHAHVIENHAQGVVVPVVNASMFMASDLATRLSVTERFAACFAIGHSVVNFSLGSHPGGADVSEIARMYGGGGHKHAAGFEMKRDEFLAWMNAHEMGEFPTPYILRCD